MFKFLWTGRRLRSVQLVHFGKSKDAATQELLRQASLSFNLALLLVGVSASVHLAGVWLFLAERITEGTLTTIGAVASYLIPLNCLRLSGQAVERLCDLIKSAS